MALPADLTSAVEAARVAVGTIRELANIDIPVNTGLGYPLNTSNHVHRLGVVVTAEYENRRVLDSNLTTAFLTFKGGFPSMIDPRTGVIIGLVSRDVVQI